MNPGGPYLSGFHWRDTDSRVKGPGRSWRSTTRPRRWWCCSTCPPWRTPAWRRCLWVRSTFSHIMITRETEADTLHRVLILEVWDLLLFYWDQKLSPTRVHTAWLLKASDHCGVHTTWLSGVAFSLCCVHITRWIDDRRFHQAATFPEATSRTWFYRVRHVPGTTLLLNNQIWRTSFVKFRLIISVCSLYISVIHL